MHQRLLQSTSPPLSTGPKTPLQAAPNDPKGAAIDPRFDKIAITPVRNSVFRTATRRVFLVEITLSSSKNPQQPEFKKTHARLQLLAARPRRAYIRSSPAPKPSPKVSGHTLYALHRLETIFHCREDTGDKRDGLSVIGVFFNIIRSRLMAYQTDQKVHACQYSSWIAASERPWLRSKLSGRLSKSLPRSARRP